MDNRVGTDLGSVAGRDRGEQQGKIGTAVIEQQQKNKLHLWKK